MSAIQVLLHESIDYAGLFPPAELDMGQAFENYARYTDGTAGWALGRFIVPAARLAELEPELKRFPGQRAHRPWRLAALLGADANAEVPLIESFNHRYSEAGIVIDTVEVKASSKSGVGEMVRAVPSRFRTYIEIPIEGDLPSLLGAIGGGGRRAKVRTGGVTQAAFPQTRDLLRFLRAATDLAVPFKATAGLHHPLHAEYKLTYARNSPTATMFGFLNLMLAVAALRSGMNDPELQQLLEEADPGAIQADGLGIAWRNRRFDLDALRDARRQGVNSFGSCSFTEPIEDLESLRLLAPSLSRT